MYGNEVIKLFSFSLSVSFSTEHAPGSLSPESFIFHKVVGEGGYGTVSNQRLVLRPHKHKGGGHIQYDHP